MPYTFSGIAPNLVSANPINGNNTLRLTFSADPVNSIPGDSDIALLPSNYTIFGVNPISVVSVIPVVLDPLSLDLILSDILVPGVWSVTTGIPLQDSLGNSELLLSSEVITIPETASFLVSTIAAFPFNTVHLQSAAPITNNATLRVRFTSDPVNTIPGDGDISLDPANYIIVGPGFTSVSAVLIVPSDSLSLDLILSSRLSSGNWTVTTEIPVQDFTGAAVVALDGNVVTTPETVSFVAVSVVSPEFSNIINPGSTNETCESVIRQHLNPALQGPGWDGMIAAVAAGDCPNFDNARFAFDQMYKTSASGLYLDRITANDGITRPKNVNLSDDIYRKLAINISNNKVVHNAVLEVLATFYGDDAVRSHATSSGYEPFALNNGDDLSITVDGNTVGIVFLSSEFQAIGSARAVEIAAAITRAFVINNVKAYAVAFTDTKDNNTKIKVYSGSLGLKGVVRVNGGKAQNTLKLETELGVYTGII